MHASAKDRPFTSSSCLVAASTSLSSSCSAMASSKEKELRVALMQAVVYGHAMVVEEAGKALNAHFVKMSRPTGGGEKIPKTTGPQMLDFLVMKNFKVPAQHKAQCKTHSPLMMALELGKTDIAEKLIGLGASVAFKNKDGLTALHIACNKGMPGVVSRLLLTAKEQKRFCQKKGSKKNSDCEDVINAKERPHGWTPLMYAVKSGDIETVRALVECGHLEYGIPNKKEQNVCHIAAREGQLECLKLLHDKSRSTEKDPFLQNDKKNWSVLHQVCCMKASKEEGKDEEMFKWVLEAIPTLASAGALNQKSQCGYTPFLVACEYKRLEMVKYLMNLPAVDVGACCHSNKEGKGATGLHLAAAHDAVGVAELLIADSADRCHFEAVDKNGDTALHVANKKSCSLVAWKIEKACKKKDIMDKMAGIRNNGGKSPNEVVREKILIPPEIIRLGREEEYLEALKEGKEKIPYCGLLILGEKGVGKTSLYRQLVGIKFDINVKSTEGIDKNTVDTVDRRSFNIDKGVWQEIGSDAVERYGEAVMNKVVSKFVPEASENNQIEIVVQEVDLLWQVRKIVADIEASNKDIAATAVVASMDTRPIPTPAPANPLIVARTPALTTDQFHPQPPPPKKAVNQPPVDRSPAVEVKQPPPVTSPVAAPQKEGNRPPKQKRALSVPQQAEQSATAPEGATVGRSESSGMLNRRQCSKIGDYVKGKQPFQKKEPSLVLNALDFAGEAEYRPMHHCFITRRALYVVLFKIPEMLNDSRKTIEEVRYWIHSIHAHIYPPDKTTKGEDEAINRVFLVGTHRDEQALSEREFEKINELIRSKLIRDPRCANHIYPLKVPGYGDAFFIPVENSIDVTHEEYLVHSGTKCLQDEIKNVYEDPERLPFLHEYYPIKWLHFEQDLELMSKARNPPIAKMEEVEEIANNSQIEFKKKIDEKLPEFEVAIRFFYDAGKFFFLKYLSNLFLGKEKEEKEALVRDLRAVVVLDPDWLVKVMKVIMELKTTRKEPGVPSSLINELEMNGIADLKLLEHCWKKFVASPDVEMRHLCLMLQANCLIYPVQPTSGNSVQKYIIPSKLPHDIDMSKYSWVSGCATFYFDFRKFLPDEIYHKLICLASSEAKSPDSNCYSSKCCVFYNLSGTNWVMEMEEDKLKIRVILQPKKKSPIQRIKFVHEKLSSICQESGLQGLQYHGGPVALCKCEDNVLRCVIYDKAAKKPANNDFDERTEIECIGCKNPYVANDLLLKSAGINCPPPDRCTAADFKEAHAILKKYSHKWRDIGSELGFTLNELDIIQGTPRLLIGGPASYMDAMFSDWLMWAPGDARDSTGYATLDSLRTAVDEAGLGITAEELDKLRGQKTRTV